MSKTYSMQGPDGKTYSIVGPDNADPGEVKKRIMSQYKTAQAAPPTMTQRVKGAVGKMASKAATTVEKNIPDFMRGSDTWPEIGGQVAGQMLGSRAGLLGSVLGGGIGSVAGTVGPGILKQAGQMYHLRRPETPNFDRERMKRSFERGATFSALGEAIPIGWRGAKAAGRTLREGMGALEGVSDRLGQLSRLPLLKQIKVVMPGMSRSIPSPEVAGAMQGAVEKRLGIPTVRSSVDLGKIYGVPKTGTSVAKTAVKGMPDLANMSPETRSLAEAELKKLGLSSAAKENPATIALRVHEQMAHGIEPAVNDAVIALRQTAKKLIPMSDGVEKGILDEQYGKLVSFIAKKIPEYGKARNLTNLANLRDTLMSALPISPKGDPYRFGVMRLIYMASSFLAGRFNPMAGVLMAGAMSPYAGALGTIGGDLATKALDPLLGNRATGALAGGGLAYLQNRNKKKDQ